jgi:ectoine hydroxylase-related dioxygenase (phytanoyl-CoA dioxygenase family)
MVDVNSDARIGEEFVMNYEPEKWKSDYQEDGPTIILRGSHKVSDEEAQQPRWRSVEESSLNFADKVEVCCPAGSGVFFSPKVIHAAGHNRSDHPRRTLNSVWTGPDVLPTSSARQPYEGLKPRSRNPACREQLRLTFPKLFPLQE